MLVLHFAVSYSFSVLVAVCTRSTVACIFGSILFWLVCWGINFGRHYAVALPDLLPGTSPMSPLLSFMADAGYWLMPKPADFVVVLEQALNVGQHFAAPSTWDVFTTVDRRGAFQPELAVASSLGFAAVTLAMSGRQLATTDY
jgi:hypothetical protein